MAPAPCPTAKTLEDLYYPTLRNLFNMKLFVDTDADSRLARRVLRDIEERGRDLEHVLHQVPGFNFVLTLMTLLFQYTTLVKPAFEEFCLPTKKYADVIVPRGAENTVAIDLIKQHIQVGQIVELMAGHKPSPI